MAQALYICVLSASLQLLGRTAQAHVHADADPYVGAMAIERAAVDVAEPHRVASFERPIPRTIHRFHFNPAAGHEGPSDAAWRSYTAQLGYAIRIWGFGDLAELKALMDADTVALVEEAWAAGHWQFVSYVARMAVLASRGGVYVGDGLWPPHARGFWVDFTAVMPMEGLVVTTDWHGRNIARASLFAIDGLVMAAPGHPVIEHIHRNLASNHAKLVSRQLGYLDGYDGGAFVLNRALSGTVTVVSIRQWQVLGVLDDAEGAAALIVE